MGPVDATPRWFICSNPELAELFEPGPETPEFMVCVRRDIRRYAGYLKLDHDKGEIAGILAPDHRGQGLETLNCSWRPRSSPTAVPVCRRYGRVR
ncbi:hypothetical protein [Streptomyces sp. RG80]|uniref:hypothetical protein n=1 Tax=Streptomyces sp. RG80 TaxID=3157340 RepID=UPI00338DA4FC